MTVTARTFQRATGCWFCLVVCLLSGCNFFTQASSLPDTLPDIGYTQAAQQAQVARQAPQGPSFTLEVHAAGRRPESKTFPLNHQTSVQQVLLASGLTKRFSRMQLKVMRLAKGGDQIPLDVAYNHETSAVESHFDYMLYPGDRLIVTEDTRTALNDLLDGVMAPLGIKS